MARYVDGSAVSFANTAGLSALAHRFVQAADPAILEQLLADQFAAFAADEDHAYLMVFLDLAGAGDGHVFTMHTVWGDDDNQNAQVGDGLAPTAGAIACYMASQADALGDALLALRTRLGALVQPPDGEIEIAQTQLAGAQQGTRVMGAVVYSVDEPEPG